MRKIIYSVIIFIFFCIATETFFRVYISFYNPNPQRVTDDFLGWKNKAYFSTVFNKKGVGKINFSTNNHGFRVWGNPNSIKKKILFVGDSYTEASQISDGYCYYNYLDSSIYEIFAFGCSGYGSLQELMAIEPLLSSISPDLIIWQFCHNDLINNSLNLEKESFINNLLLRKPYLINNEIVYDYPHKYKWIGVVESYSVFLLWSHYKLNNFLYRRYGSIEERFNLNEAQFKASYHTTKNIYQRIKQLNLPVVVFSATTSFGYEEIISICDELQIPFIDEVNIHLDSLTENGIKLDLAPYDWHWNENGHKEAGKVINKKIENYL